jgi:hypothetical protein
MRLVGLNAPMPLLSNFKRTQIYRPTNPAPQMDSDLAYSKQRRIVTHRVTHVKERDNLTCISATAHTKDDTYLRSYDIEIHNNHKTINTITAKPD